MNEDYPKRGRPPLSRTEPTVVVSVTITESQAERLKELGDGNASLGARRLLENEETD